MGGATAIIATMAIMAVIAITDPELRDPRGGRSMSPISNSSYCSLDRRIKLPRDDRAAGHEKPFERTFLWKYCPEGYEGYVRLLYGLLGTMRPGLDSASNT